MGGCSRQNRPVSDVIIEALEHLSRRFQPALRFDHSSAPLWCLAKGSKRGKQELVTNQGGPNGASDTSGAIRARDRRPSQRRNAARDGAAEDGPGGFKRPAARCF